MLRYCSVEFSKLHMHETFVSVSKPILKNLELTKMDFDSFIFTFKANDVIEEFKFFSNFFCLSNFGENYYLFSNAKKAIGKSMVQTPKSN